MARSESISGKRGLPGGGATTGSGADTGREHTLGPVRFQQGLVRTPRSFPARLALILAGALAVRVLYTVLLSQDIPVIGDALTFPLLVGALDTLGADSFLAQKLLLCLVGTATVGFVGLAGREAAGATVGVVAAGLSAVYPFLWVVDGSLMSETLYGTLVAALLWLSLRFAKRPSLGLAAGLGVLVSLAALTRGDALLLVPLLLVPLAFRAGATWRSRATLAAVGLATFALVLAPWIIRNLTVFEEPVVISTNGDAVFVGANCDPVYYGDLIGLWKFDCYGVAP